MSTFREQPAAINEFDEQVARQLVEKVTVYEDRFTVVFVQIRLDGGCAR